MYYICRLTFSFCLCRVTFSRVFKKKSTEEFSCFPYVMTLFNCLIYTWYGLPIVSHLWENLPLVTINGVGILLESIFIFIYFYYASPKEKVKYSLESYGTFSLGKIKTSDIDPYRI